MKSFFFTMVLLSLATFVSAQSKTCCIPCPPGCCNMTCDVAPGTAASLPGTTDISATTPVNCSIIACCVPQKMSKKDIKACMKSCASGKSVDAAQCEIKCAPGAAADAEQKTDVIYHGVPKAHKG